MNRFFALIVLLVFVVFANATNIRSDSLNNKSNVQIIVGNQGNEQDVENAFKDNIPKDKTVAGMPHFAIVGKHKRFYLGIGANFKASASFDFGNEMPSGIDFVPSQISPSTPGNGANTRFSAQSSAIYLNFIAMPNNPNKTGLFFSGNFKGENYGFQLNHFYIKYRGLKLGYSHSAFTDNDAVPFTIDEQGPCGMASLKLLMAMWTQPLGKGFYATIGVDAPKFDLKDISEQYQLVNQRLPSVPLWVQYQNDCGHIRLSGLLRPMQYRDQLLEKNKTRLGWGIQLSGMYGFFQKFKVYYGANYGEGISKYVQDCSNMQIDLLPSVGIQSKMIATPIWSCDIGAEYNFSDKFVTNILYSRANMMYDRGVAVDGNMSKSTQYIAANILYKFKSFAKVGIEYNWGYRKSISSDSEQTNRIQCLLSIEI